MDVKVFESAEEQTRGLQFMDSIPEKTVFLFPVLSEGGIFHSRNVAEPFDLAFVSKNGKILFMQTLHPPYALAEVPPGSDHAVESKGGYLTEIGFVVGHKSPL